MSDNMERIRFVSNWEDWYEAEPHESPHNAEHRMLWLEKHVLAKWFIIPQHVKRFWLVVDTKPFAQSIRVVVINHKKPKTIEIKLGVQADQYLEVRDGICPSNRQRFTYTGIRGAVSDWINNLASINQLPTISGKPVFYVGVEY